MKKFIPVFLFFVLVFIAGWFQHDDPDMYVHLAMGNIIAHQGIIHHEVLSQADPSREYIPFEWLFQLLFYQFINVFGFNSYHVFIALFATLQTAVLYALLRKVFRVTNVFAICLSVLYVILTYNYFVPRPQIIANTFLLLTLFILFKYVLHHKNYLYVLLPIAYVWGNMHASVVLSILLCLFYSALCFVGIFTKTRKQWLKKSGILGLYALGIFIVTILPPQGFNAYKDILLIFKYGYINAAVNQEWIPLLHVPYQAIFYSILVTGTLANVLFVVIKKRIFAASIWLSPMILFILYGYLSLRNVYFGYLAVIILWGWILQKAVVIHTWSQVKIIACIICMVLLFGYSSKTTYTDYALSQYQFPADAVDFIQKENIQGNMFNEFAYGGYLEYKLYPSQKIFMDGRVESFFCCEMQDYYNLYKNLPSTLSTFQNQFNNLLEKYHTSYVVLVSKNSIDNILGVFLSRNPKWMLIYKDNISQIWIKNDGKNSKLLQHITTQPTHYQSEKSLFYNHTMHITFNYPKNLMVSQINPHLVLLKNPSSTSADSSIYIFTTSVVSSTKAIDIPFFIEGKIKQQISIPVHDFTAKQITYTDGLTLLTLQKDQQFILVRIPKDSKDVADAITDFVNSVKTLQ